MEVSKTADGLRSKLIERILSTNNEQLLNAIATIFESTSLGENEIHLSKSHIEILKMAETDLKYGNLITQEELDKIDEEWMN